MSVLKIAYAALVLPLLFSGCAAGDQCTMPLATVIPMTLTPDGTELTVPARVHGKPIVMKVDTGAVATFLSRDALPNRQADRGESDFVGVGGFSTGDPADLSHVELGALHGGMFAVLTDEHFSGGGRRVDGLIGMTVLGAYDVDLDVPDGQMRLYKPLGNCSQQPVAVMAPPLYVVPKIAGPDPLLHADVTVVIDNQSFTALVDTGAESTALFRSAARRLGLTPQVLAADRAEVVHGTGEEGVSARWHTLDAMSVGDLTIKNLPVAVIDQDMRYYAGVDMLLGIDFIRRVHMWISSSSGHLVIQFPPMSSPALPKGM